MIFTGVAVLCSPITNPVKNSINLPKVIFINRDSVIFDSWFPSFYRSTASKRAISLIKHKYFRNIFDLVILANAIFIAFDLDGGENVFLTIFTLEIALKLYAFGIRAFFRKMWNVFDVVVVGSAITVSILRAAIGQDISREVPR